MTSKDLNQDNFLLALAISLATHLVVIAIILFGLPSFFIKTIPEEQVIAIEILPIADVSNIQTQKVQKEKAVEAIDAKKVQKSKEKEVVKEPEEAKREDKPEVKKDVVKIPDKTPPDKKPEPKKDKPKEKKKNDTDLDSLLKTLEKESDGKEEKSKKQSMSEKTDAEVESKGQFNEDMPMSISEEMALRQQIERHWNIPAGAQNVDEITITLHIILSQDGSVDKVEILNKQCGAASSVLCEAVADSALRAAQLASPFQNLSPERFNAWKENNFVFAPMQ
jgi:outer membrane biosynthesis protein TonB